MSSQKIEPQNPAITMMNSKKTIDKDNHPMFFILQNYSRELKKATNRRKLQLLRAGIDMEDANKALDYFDYDDFVIIQNKIRRNNVEIGEYQLMMIMNGFDPSFKEDQFEVIDLDNLNDESSNSDSRSIVSHGTSTVRSRSPRTFSESGESPSFASIAMNGNNFPTLDGATTPMTHTTNPDTSSETGQDIVKDFVSHFQEMDDDNKFMEAAVKICSITPDWNKYEKLVSCIWHVRNGMNQMAQMNQFDACDIPNPPEELLE
tara:strand:- start:158 stop:940 length:783 start_codon:yes stop_codon:yes gene_type:complete